MLREESRNSRVVFFVSDGLSTHLPVLYEAVPDDVQFYVCPVPASFHRPLYWQDRCRPPDGSVLHAYLPVEAKYTVTARNIQITLNNKNATYGDVVSAETTFGVTSGSLVNDSDDLGLTFTVTTAEKYVVNGDYTISATASNDNYNVEVISAKYVVGVKAIKIVVLIKTYRITINNY